MGAGVDSVVGSGGGSLSTRVCASSALKGLACCLCSSSASQSPAGLFRNFSRAENYLLRIRSCCCSYDECSSLEGAGRLLRTSDSVASRATRTSYRPCTSTTSPRIPDCRGRVCQFVSSSSPNLKLGLPDDPLFSCVRRVIPFIGFQSMEDCIHDR